MSAPVPPDDVERRLRNLQAVARHHSQPRETPAKPTAAEDDSWKKTWKKRLVTLGPLGALLIFAATKLKLIVPLLKFTKLPTLLTMLVAVWALLYRRYTRQG